MLSMFNLTGPQGVSVSVYFLSQTYKSNKQVFLNTVYSSLFLFFSLYSDSVGMECLLCLKLKLFAFHLSPHHSPPSWLRGLEDGIWENVRRKERSRYLMWGAGWGQWEYFCNSWRPSGAFSCLSPPALLLLARSSLWLISWGSRWSPDQGVSWTSVVIWLSATQE